MALQPLGLTSKIVAYNNEVDLRDKTPAPTMQPATIDELMKFAPSLDGTNSVFVKPVGTAEENGVALLAALEAAIDKVVTTTIPPENLPTTSFSELFPFPDRYVMDLASGQNPPDNGFQPYSAIFTDVYNTTYNVQITILGFPNPGRVEFEMQDLNGGFIPTDGSPDFPTAGSVTKIPSTLMIAPGDYSIASDFILDDVVNVTSLTGQADVNISTNDVKVQSGANSENNPITITGLNLTSSLYIESNLAYLTFKNCTALGDYSFSIEPSGTGAISGKFEDCIGGARSFGGSQAGGVTAAGLFIRCKATGSYAFGGKGTTSGKFEHCGGAPTSNGSVTEKQFGYEGDVVNGYFYYCIGGNNSFASQNTGATGAEFYYCIAGNQSFAYRNTNNSGKFYNCSSSGNQSFGSTPLSGNLAPNARYYNCTANTIAQSATGISSKFYNCHAATNWAGYSAGNDGLAYNCSFGAFGGQSNPTGTGKYRNCLSSTSTIINQG